MEERAEVLPILVDATEAGKLLRLSRSQVNAMARNGELPHVHIGRLTRYPVDALRAWAQRQAEREAELLHAEPDLH